MAKRITKAQRAQDRADEFRSAVAELLRSDTIWSTWEENWLVSESRRPAGYIFSDKEHAVLDRMRIAASGPFYNYGDYSVRELIVIAYPWRFDLDEDGSEFLETLNKTEPAGLTLRSLRRLVGICRAFEGLDLPHDIDPPKDLRTETEQPMVSAPLPQQPH
jgi:hypothetical protein